MPDNGPADWLPAQRRLHWWSAALIAGGFVIAWVMVAVPLSALLVKFLLYQLHKTIGLIALGLIVWRLILRVRRGRPPFDAELPAWHVRTAMLGHSVLYGLGLVVPVLGYFVAATAPAQVPTLFLFVVPVPHLVGVNEAAFAWLRAVHRGAAIALVIVAAGHAGAAIRHHLAGRSTLRRMWSMTQ